MTLLTAIAIHLDDDFSVHVHHDEGYSVLKISTAGASHIAAPVKIFFASGHVDQVNAIAAALTKIQQKEKADATSL